MTKWVYTFGDGSAQGNAKMREVLGGKGANLAEMCSLGLLVPPGFTITTEVCNSFYENNKRFPDGLKQQVNEAIDFVQNLTQVKFGDTNNPLLVSVRSGARASMPGMMDTVLNLGLNDSTVNGLAISSNNEIFAWDSYRRFIQMYGDVVLGIEHHKFEEIIEEEKNSSGIILDSELTFKNLCFIVDKFKKIVLDETEQNFPQEPIDQLWGAISAVFGSWSNPRAETYRKLNDIPKNWGTAVNVQAMVFGNMGNDSATGVAFTRNPSSGEKSFFGEFLVNAQGEDVVAGIRTPRHLTKVARINDKSSELSMEEEMPEVYLQLEEVYQTLEKHYRDMQDIEFTVQRGKLWMLQTRSGKRTARAAIKIAVDMVNEGLISKSEAINRIDPSSLDQLLHPMLDPNSPRDVIGNGLPASPGAASGNVVFSAEEAEHQKSFGNKVILVREETSPDDIHGMHAAEGILTSRGGMTSHAAVVARGMGKPCISGVSAMDIDLNTKKFTLNNKTIYEGDSITIDGSLGQVIFGEVSMIQPELSSDFSKLIQWADSFRQLKVRANAETPSDARSAIKFGAEGIGLCRTEHMFFDSDRILNVRRMILAENIDDRIIALDQLLDVQRNDFIDLFRIMKNLPVTIRLLDPPLHEFLPHTDEEISQVASFINASEDKVNRKLSELREVNPMLGHRGCRLGVSYPEIYEMQARAIFEAVSHVSKEINLTIIPEIMIPLVATAKELSILKKVVDDLANTVMSEKKVKFNYLVGTMIELPRAALCADEIADEAEFFSFGTNDLTQTTLGISRDDSSNFLDDYINKGIFSIDPFISIDQRGVGKLVEIGVNLGRKTRKDLKLGICGEHGGDPNSIKFFNSVGLDYVSASPYRVPIARLSAAQAALSHNKKLQKN